MLQHRRRIACTCIPDDACSLAGSSLSSAVQAAYGSMTAACAASPAFAVADRRCASGGSLMPINAAVLSSALPSASEDVPAEVLPGVPACGLSLAGCLLAVSAGRCASVLPAWAGAGAGGGGAASAACCCCGAVGDTAVLSALGPARGCAVVSLPFALGGEAREPACAV